MAYIDVELDIFDTDELIDELGYRTLSKTDRKYLMDILKDNDYPSDDNVKSLLSPTLLGEQVYNALAELVKSKTELELLELFEKAK